MNKRNLSRLAGRLYGVPLMIQPDKAAVIERVFQSYLAGDRPLSMDDEDRETPEQRAEREHAERVRAYAGIELQKRTDKPYALTTSGIALVPVMGTLIQRGSWMDAMSGLTGYDEIGALVGAAVADPEARAVVLEIDSPGGQVNGAFELADKIVAMSGKKKIYSHANEAAFSAAYLLASSADRIYAPITGAVGSIGVLALHLDQSKRDAQMGYTYTLIYAGARKVDLNSHKPLTDAARSNVQEEVDRVYQLFVSHVAEQRSLTAEAVIGTEAGVMAPPEALHQKFIDGVATLAEVVALLEGELGSGTSSVSPGARMNADRLLSTTESEASIMDTKDKGAAPAANAADQPKHTDAQLEAARTEARAEGVKAGSAEGIKAERDRVRAIMIHAEAKDRQELALSIATETDMSAEQAAKLLAAAPKQASGSALAALMAKEKNPAVGVDGDPNAAVTAQMIDSAAIFESRRTAQRAN
ncbi:MAG TPA: S49 family peptidase [Burkholderiales bacterium]|nr:S49 family peptidase [Burkholderiales bacterium]